MIKPPMSDVARIATILSLYDPKFSQMSYNKIVAECENVFTSKIELTKEGPIYLEQPAISCSVILYYGLSITKIE